MSLIFRYCFILTILTSNNVFAQSEKDSLLSLIRTMPEDTNKMDVYFNFGLLMEHENLDSASYYYDKAGKISDQYNHVKGKIKYITYRSYILNMQDKLDDAYRLNKQALQLARKHGLKLEMAKTLANLANTHNFRGELDTAVQYYIESASLFSALNNTRHLNILYMNIGTAFDALEQYEKAVEYQKKSVRFSRAAEDSLTLIRAFINMASSMNSLTMYDSALHRLEVALTYTRQHEYTAETYNALINYANSLSKKKRKDEAFEAFEEAFGMATKLEYNSGKATALNGLAMVLFEQQKYAEADKYAMQAIRIGEQPETGVFTGLRQQYKLLADIKAKLGQTQAAYHYLQQYVTLNDSLSGQDVKRLTANLERKYQVAQKDKELVQKELKIQQAENIVRARNTQLMIVAGGLILTLVILFLLYRFYQQRQRLQQQQVHALRQEQEVIRLRSNLEGQQEERMRIAKEIHDDIGSGLTSLVFLTSALPGSVEMNEKKEKISGIARQMVSQMNEIVWSLNSDQDSLEDLIIYIRHSISEMLDTVGIEYQFSIPETIPAVHVTGARRRHIFLVIKEAIHNIMKHAQATKVTLSMSFTDHIHISIEDNGRGMSADKRNGNGLKNMQHRMKQVGGEWELSSIEPVKINLTVPLAQTI